MDKPYVLIFDDVILKQLKKVSKNQNIKNILKKMFDKLELAGPAIGKLLDSKLFLYELKNMHPPIRLYFRHDKSNDELHVFEFEIKTRKETQQKTTQKIKYKSRHLKS